MKTDKRGCSTCPNGREHWEFFFSFNGSQLIQYDFRTTDGELFSTVCENVEEARRERDEWLEEVNQ